MSFIAVPELDRQRLAKYVNERLKLPMIAYEIATEGKIYEWHLEKNVDGMDEVRDLVSVAERDVSVWLDSKKAAL